MVKSIERKSAEKLGRSSLRVIAATKVDRRFENISIGEDKTIGVEINPGFAQELSATIYRRDKGQETVIFPTTESFLREMCAEAARLTAGVADDTVGEKFVAEENVREGWLTIDFQPEFILRLAGFVFNDPEGRVTSPMRALMLELRQFAGERN